MTSPLSIYQKVETMKMPSTGVILMQVCTERFPDTFYRHAFTVVILLAQYVVPLIVLPTVHTKILVFLRYIGYDNWKFQVSGPVFRKSFHLSIRGSSLDQ